MRKVSFQGRAPRAVLDQGQEPDLRPGQQLVAECSVANMGQDPAQEGEISMRGSENSALREIQRDCFLLKSSSTVLGQKIREQKFAFPKLSTLFSYKGLNELLKKLIVQNLLFSLSRLEQGTKVVTN